MGVRKLKMGTYKNPIPSVDAEEKTEKQYLQFDIEEYTSKESVYFAFIDVLGFKKAFDDNRILKNNNLAEKFKEVFKYYFDLMGSADFSINRDRPLYYAGQTSDSLYFYTERVDILIDFLKIFSHFYIYAMTQDVFFRGGIAKGNLFWKEHYQFYGESVINAYLLESEVSRNPIIMIDENTYEEIKSVSEHDKLIISEHDRHFLGPFSFLEHNFNLNINEPALKIREIDQIKLQEIIEGNKSKFEYDSRNYDKYVFLLKEYNAYKSRVMRKIGG